MINDGKQNICYICSTGKFVFYKRFRNFEDALMRGGAIWKDWNGYCLHWNRC
ncbi:hypothetical protein BRYFOR_08564 [Marvinbryantia formatexigens DSM 14469]|uniref:Uncharacterized protein n=1 Tax=Marvinbryantia formatexigens DSM 14469 TaxID=478749 RepID=C6LIT4_9FIRM|nr:hypothetical protein BRYFOR_08564 [Marvinbryantia formatexigens DSM 14469]